MDVIRVFSRVTVGLSEGEVLQLSSAGDVDTSEETYRLIIEKKTAGFIAGFEVPHSLKDAGVPRAEIGDIVDPVMHELEKAKVVDRPVTKAEVIGLLEASY